VRTPRESCGFAESFCHGQISQVFLSMGFYNGCILSSLEMGKVGDILQGITCKISPLSPPRAHLYDMIYPRRDGFVE
jgi:hypothetical protein